jgi:hypothetical protein
MIFGTSIISSQEWIRLIEAATREAPAVIADAIN